MAGTAILIKRRMGFILIYEIAHPLWCVCVCVREREIEREPEKKRERGIKRDGERDIKRVRERGRKKERVKRESSSRRMLRGSTC